MRATSSFTHTGSVVLIRLVTSNSLRRKFMRASSNCIVFVGLLIRACPFSGDRHLTLFVRLSQGVRAAPSEARVLFSKIFGGMPMVTATAESAEEIKRRIGELNLEHRDLDRAIEALEAEPPPRRAPAEAPEEAQAHAEGPDLHAAAPVGPRHSRLTASAYPASERRRPAIGGPASYNGASRATRIRHAQSSSSAPRCSPSSWVSAPCPTGPARAAPPAPAAPPRPQPPAKAGTRRRASSSRRPGSPR